MRATGMAIACVLVGVLAFAAAEQIERGEFEVLKERVARLERDVDNLTARLAKAEERLAAGPGAKSTAPDQARGDDTKEPKEGRADSTPLKGRELEAWKVARTAARKDFKKWAQQEMAAARRIGIAAPGVYLKTADATVGAMTTTSAGDYVFAFPMGYVKGSKRTVEYVVKVRITEDGGEFRANGLKRAAP